MILTGTIGWDNYDDERSTGPPNSDLGGQRRLLEREERQLKKRSEDEEELGIGKEENVSGRRSSTCKDLERKRPWRMERS